MPKAKTNSSDKVLCGCGCGNILSRRQQTRHLQARGPVMVVAEVIETRAYFHEQDTESPEPPRPCKRQRLQTPIPEDNLPQPPAQQEQSYTPPDVAQQVLFLSPTTSPAPLPRNLVVSRAANEVLSAPWMGPGALRRDDDDIFEDSNDIGDKVAQPLSIPSPMESESSDMDSDTDIDDDGIGSSRSDTGGIPNIFETNADLNAAEYSESTVISSW